MKRCIVIWLCVILVFSSMVMVADLEDVVEAKEVVGDGVDYIFADPFRIDSNGDFAANANGGGDGSAVNPWIIENYNIYGTGYGYCIYIGNTTDHFIIRDSKLQDASGVNSLPFFPNVGLVLFNVQNGTFENNIVTSNDWFGIYSEFSNFNKIINNSITSNVECAINLINSNNNLIANNTALFNFWACEISIASSDNNKIINNTISGNGVGIEVTSGIGNTIDNNTVYGNVYAIELRSSSNYNNVTSNIIYDNMEGLTIVSSSNNIIAYNNISTHSGTGLNIGGTANTIQYNTVMDNDNGIYFLWSNGNSANDNTLINNNRGISVLYSSYIDLVNNSCKDDGVYMDGNALDHWNTHSIDMSNTVNGKPVYYWKNQTGGTVPTDGGEVILANCTNIIVQDQIVNNSCTGIILGYSSYNLISNNTAFNNTLGMSLHSSHNNSIMNNTVVNNTEGIKLKTSIDNQIFNNTASNNDFWGFYLTESHNNSIWNATIENNNNGIITSNSNNNHLSSNFIANSTMGINFYYSKWQLLADNVMVNNGVFISGNSMDHWNTHSISTTNTVNGLPVQYLKNQTSGTVPLNAGQVILANCSNVSVTKQNLDNCTSSILLGYSSYNTISDNNVQNSYYGMHISSSVNNTIMNNGISDNYFGLFLSSSSGSSIHHNNFIDNVYQGSNSGSNQWDDGYPSGGNYWSDYSGVDNNNGAAQDIPGSDDIGDTPYTIGSAQDDYPLMEIYDPSTTPHSPIRINNNSDFDPVHGVTNGSGTPIDPWIIEGWNIDGAGYGYCIYIGNTTEYFVVRDCYLHEASGGSGAPYFPDYGLILFSADNGKLINNTVMLNVNIGIYFSFSDNNYIEYNNVSSNDNGIWLFQSNNNILNGNNISDNIQIGISLGMTTANTLMNNQLYGNSVIIQGNSLQYWNTHSIDESNMVNGKPIRYYKNQTSGTVPQDAGEVILANCTNMIVSNITINEVTIGIELGYSHDNYVINNTLSNNKWIGVYCEASYNNYIYHNNLINNFWQAYDDNTNNWNASYPIGGNYWNDYAGIDNNNGINQDIPGSDGMGDIPYTNILSGTGQDNYPLMYPLGLPVHNIDTNEFFMAIQEAIDDPDTIDGHTISVSAEIYYENINVSKSLTLVGNDNNTTIIDGNGNSNVVNITANWVNLTGFTIRNSGSGFDDWGIDIQSSNNNVSYCNVLLNYNGIKIYNSFSNHIVNCSVQENDWHAIQSLISGNSIIMNCNVSDSLYGILLDGSENCYLVNNNIWNSSMGLLAGGNQKDHSNHTIQQSNMVNGKAVYYFFDLHNQSIQDLDAGHITLAWCDNITLADSNVNTGDYIYVTYTTNSLINNINAIDSYKGIWLSSAMNVTISNSYTKNNRLALDIQGDDNRVHQSKFENNLFGIYVCFSSNNIIENCEVFNNTYYGIKTGYMDNSMISGCNISNNNDQGIMLSHSSNNNINTCTIRNNGNEGIMLFESSNSNTIYHNNIIDNAIQAFDDFGTNSWDNGYPSGGNYWSDYAGVDNYTGINQNIPGPDTIGDTPYTNIDGGIGAQDLYPLMDPFNDTLPQVTDSTPPTIISTTPANGRINVAPNTSVTIQFSESMNTTTVENAVSIAPSASISSYTWSANNTTLAIVFTANLTQNTTYDCLITTSALDVNGNALATNYSWSFTTWLDTDNDGIPDVTDPDDDNDGVPDEDDSDPLDPDITDAVDPVADSGDDQTIIEGTIVIFDGSDSTDNLGIVIYTWAFIDGSTTIVLYGESPTYNFTTAGNYTITLTVADAAGNTDTDSMLVTVEEPPLDTDGDGIPDETDPDDDNDDTPDSEDDFPLDPDETTDTDGDGIGDNADTDDDDDGFLDEWEEVLGTDPTDPDDTPTDTDDDGIPDGDDTNSEDWMDTDDDGDRILDVDDDEPLVPNEIVHEDDDPPNTWLYLIIILVIVGVIGAILVMKKKGKEPEEEATTEETDKPSITEDEQALPE